MLVPVPRGNANSLRLLDKANGGFKVAYKASFCWSATLV